MPQQEVTLIAKESALGCSLAARWQKNSAAIPPKSSLHQYLKEYQDPLSQEILCRTPDANYGIVSKDEDHSSLELFSDLSSIEIRCAEYQQALADRYPVFFLGCGMGETLMALQEGIKSPQQVAETYEGRILFIENDPVLFHAALYFFDLTIVLASFHHLIAIGDQFKTRVAPETNRNIINIYTIPNRDQTTLKGALQSHLLHNQEALTILPTSTAAGTTVHRQLFGNGVNNALRARFAANLKLLETYQHCYCDKNFLDEISQYHGHFDHTSEQEIFLAYQEAHDTHIQTAQLSPSPSAIDARAQYIAQHNTDDATWLLHGVGEGSILELLLEKTVYQGQWLDYQQIIYLLDPQPALIACWLHLKDLSDLLPKNRLRLFLGPACQQSFMSYLQENQYAPIPHLFLPNTYNNNSQLEASIAAIQTFNAKLSQRALQLQAACNSYYRAKPRSYWKSRFAGNCRLKIIGFTTRMSSFIQYCARDLVEGFSEAGHQAILLIEPNAASRMRVTTILETINEQKADLFFMIGHFRQEYPWMPDHFPFMFWIQDMLPAIRNFQGFTLGFWDFPYSISKVWAETIPRMNKTFANKEIKVLPIGYNSTVFFPLKVASYLYDIAYISHLFDPEKTFAPLTIPGLTLRLDPLEQRLVEAEIISFTELIKLYRFIDDHLQSCSLEQLTSLVTRSRENGLPLLDFLSRQHQVAFPEALRTHLRDGQNRLFYHVMNRVKMKPILLLKSLGFAVAVWGNNWHRYPAAKTIGKGIADNATQVNEIQNRAKININNSGGLSLHMKAIEIIASKSFMLSRRIINDGHKLTDYFTEDQEVVFFNDEQDLVKKTSYFLDNQALRKELAQRAYDTLVKRFSYQRHAHRIVKDISEAIAQQ